MALHFCSINTPLTAVGLITLPNPLVPPAALMTCSAGSARRVYLSYASYVLTISFHTKNSRLYIFRNDHEAVV
jgi:hypothetical protein